MGKIVIIIAVLLLACIVLSTVAPLCAARTEERVELITDGVVFGNDFYKSSNIQSLFHQQSLASSDQEQSSIAFPNTLDLNAAGADSVGMAMPSIEQDTLQSTAAVSTGFFTANYEYRPETVYGNVPLSSSYISSLGQAIQPAPVSLSMFAPEQYDVIAIRNKMKELNNTAPASESANETKSNDTGIAANSGLGNSSVSGLLGSGDKRSNLMNLFTAKNASTEPEIPLVYPSDFDMAFKDAPVIPNLGIGSFSTNGAGSTGASLTGPLAGNRQISQSNTSQLNTSKSNTSPSNTSKSNTTGNNSAETGLAAAPIVPTQVLNYADFNFDATTAQINNMTLVERMWRNAHRGGMMGKAYAGDTAAPIWIDPFPRPGDLPMIGEHWFILQSALNMCVPGTQIMPRFWSLMF